MGNEHRIFIERLLITAAFVLLLLVFWALRSLLILAFGAIVIAVLIRALAAPIRRVTGLGNRGSAFLAILVIAIVIWLTGWLFGRDRKSVVKGKSVSVRVDLGGRGIIKKKKQQ